VNDFGVITGEATLLEGTTEAFRLTANRYKVIRFPGATSTSAGDVSNSGRVIGIYVDTRSLTHGFLWTAAGFQAIDFPNAILTVALGINDSGRIVGDYLDSSGVTHGFLAVPQ